MKISLFRDGYATLTTNETIDGWDEFVDIVSQPEVGQKNGDYFVRGLCVGPRSDATLRSWDLVIIDGDQLVDNGHSCCPPQLVHAVMVKAGITHTIYTSYSNDIVNNRHKWRLVLPCPDVVDAETLAQAVGEVVSILHGAGLMVRNVRENLVPSQPWFLPRCPEQHFDDFYAAWHDGGHYRLTGKILPSAHYSATNGHRDAPGSEAGCFSWGYVLGQFSAGTVHQGAKSAAGWLTRTTDWADKQIKQFLVEAISATCPAQEKIKRITETKELDNLIKYCREKSGVVRTEAAVNWKDHLTSAADLRMKEFPPVRWAVDGLIPEGLTVLAGDPKAGKSLAAVDICTAIASGGLAFGQKKCVAGVCCYCSMEDPERRVKERIATQSNVWPDTFKLLTRGLPTAGNKLLAVLDEMLLLWPNLRCVVVDTLQFIVPMKPTGMADYDFYYSILDPLHRWAVENHVALILITHLTKSRESEGDNPFARIIGSVAIQSTADAMLLLKRNHAKAGVVDPALADGFLVVQGREVGQCTMALEFDDEALRWTVAGEATADKHTGNANWLLIQKTLEQAPLGPKAISEATRINVSTVKTCLARMKVKGLVEDCEPGKWCIPYRNYHTNGGW